MIQYQYKKEAIMQNKAMIVIPSLEPDDKLLQYINELLENGLNNILVIDDGSGSNYKSIFNAIKEKGICVLTHEVNQGKGQALKTAFAHIKKHCDDITTIVTADSDGQHTVKDVQKVIEAATQNLDALVLGSRNFDLPHVPFKSRKGNKITSRVYQLFYGQYISDTQTGLRGFNRQYLDDMLAVAGERFEYEMNMLIFFSKRKRTMLPVEIETVYENNNSGTHFHPIKDSIKIYKVIFPGIFKFLSSSLFTTLLDYLCFLLFYFIFNAFDLHQSIVFFGAPMILSILFASIIARIISSYCNFRINQNFVFKHGKSTAKALVKYVVLAMLIILCSSLGTSILVDGNLLTAPIAKPVVDTLLFVVSYTVQKRWVFV